MDRHSSKFQIQDFASPTGVCPEGRYQKLSKDIQNGLDSQATWQEFVEVCLSLGKVGEAARALPHVDDLRLRKLFESQLEGQGIVLASGSSASPECEASGSHPDHAGHASKTATGPVATGHAPLGAQHVQAGGSGARRRFQSEMKQVARRVRVSRGVERESVWEECRDAIEYLLLDAMPLRILTLTLLFPAAVALGFLLPALVGESLTLVLQYAPVVIAMGLFLGYAQKILLHSAGGEEDPPDLFEDLFAMLRAGCRGFLRAGVLSVLFMGPSVLAFSLGLPWGLQAALAIVGLAYLPMALLGVTIINSWEAITPRTVGRGMAVDLTGYLKLTFVFAVGICLPVFGVVLTLDSTLANAAAVVGPLMLAPGLAIARLLGRYFYAREQSMRRALGLYRILGSQMRQEVGESSRRAGLRRHDQKRQASGRDTGRIEEMRGEQRIVEANAPGRTAPAPRGPTVAGPRSPILQHRQPSAARPQARVESLQGPNASQRPARGSKLGNHSHRPLKKK